MMMLRTIHEKVDRRAIVFLLVLLIILMRLICGPAGWSEYWDAATSTPININVNKERSLSSTKSTPININANKERSLSSTKSTPININANKERSLSSTKSTPININATKERSLSSTKSTPININANKERSLPSTNAIKCSEERSYDGGVMKSQSGEDKQLLFGEGIRFDQICNGSYIEIGALDGVQYSNSHVYHHALDQKGLLIEASPTNYKNLVENRKNDIAVVNAGVCGEERDLHWVDKPGRAVRGFLEFAAESFRKRQWSEDSIKNAQVVRCRTMKNILLETVGKNRHFDFFSLDVEGAELEVLKSIDFDEVSFGIIFVEADAHNPQKNDGVKSLLKEKGYEFLYKKMRSDWFRHPGFREIYKGVVTLRENDP